MSEANSHSIPVQIIVTVSQGKSIEWLLLRGNRGRIAVSIAVMFGIFFTGLELLGAVPLADMQALLSIYSALIVGNLTLITVVVSINQLFLSRELQTPGELQTQIENIIEYRDEVKHAAEEIPPVKPFGFLRILVEATREEAQRLGGFAKDGAITAGHEEIENVATTLTEQMDQIDKLLTEPETETFSVLSVMLETNYAEQIYKLRTIQATSEPDIADVGHESIETVIDRLREIEVSRQYFRSIYLQQELSSLSRVLLYTGLPAEAVAIGTLLFLTGPTSGPESMLTLRVLLPLTLTIALLPLAVLCSFFLRAATVTKYTAATLPFTTPEQERL